MCDGSATETKPYEKMMLEMEMVNETETRKKGKKQSEKYWNAFCLSLHTVSKHIERWIKTKRNETKMHENKLRNEMFSRLAFGMAQCFADCCFRFPLNVLSFLCCPFLLIAAINLNARSSAISPIRTRHIDTHTNDSSRAHTHTHNVSLASKQIFTTRKMHHWNCECAKPTTTIFRLMTMTKTEATATSKSTQPRVDSSHKCRHSQSNDDNNWNWTFHGIRTLSLRSNRRQSMEKTQRKKRNRKKNVSRRNTSSLREFNCDHVLVYVLCIIWPNAIMPIVEQNANNNNLRARRRFVLCFPFVSFYLIDEDRYLQVMLRDGNSPFQRHESRTLNAAVRFSHRRNTIYPFEITSNGWYCRFATHTHTNYSCACCDDVTWFSRSLSSSTSVAASLRSQIVVIGTCWYRSTTGRFNYHKKAKEKQRKSERAVARKYIFIRCECNNNKTQSTANYNK